LQERFQRWVFGGVAFAYAALVITLLPSASDPGYSTPFLIGTYGIAICLADLFTALFLVRQYRRSGEKYLAPLAVAYLFSACLVLPYSLSFPQAFGSERLIGHDTTASILFTSWRCGAAVLLFLGVWLGVRQRPATAPEKRGRYAAYAMLAGLGLAAAFIAGSFVWHMDPFVDGRFNTTSIITGWLVVILSAGGLLMIFTTRSQAHPIFGWLALVMAGTVADMTLSTFGGGRFTLGWYIARCSTVVSSYLLLAYLASEFARDLKHRPAAARAYTYVAALALAVCAVLLRYFLNPWLGLGLPYTTLFGAVAVAVWMGGWGPGVVTATVGFLFFHVFVRQLTVGLEFAGASDVLAVVLYSVSAAFIIALGHNMRAARKSAERAEERFRHSQEAAIQGYAMLRAMRAHDGKIVDFAVEYINPRGAALARVKGDEVLGKPLTQVLPGVVSGGVFKSFCSVVDTGEPLESEARYEQNGRVGWFRNMIVKMDDGIAVSFFNITHSKQLERELAQRAHQLERADANKSQFLATLSHELRNPLAPLRNGLAVLRRRMGAGGEDMLAMMDRQLHQLVRLVDDLLDVSRIDRGKIQIKRERVLVDSAITAAIETARPAIDAKSHELVVRYTQGSLHVEGDAVRLAQIVSNLLINAAKFTPPNGRVEVALRAVENEVEISVRDNGMGIPAEQLPHIFDMFVQLDSNKQGGGGGLGLGLALVRSLVELHGGRVEARSAGREQGAEFVVRLPLAAAASETPAARSSVASGSHGHRVIVVDDNEDGARSLGALLAAQGHNVAVYLKAEEALAAADEIPPRVAFIDLNMPGMDGLELARRLRATREGATMRLVAVTGMGRESDIARTRAAGFDVHLTKPADPDRIMELATNLTDIHTVVPFRVRGARDPAG
jgi:signal transduction histidine kinase/CheY-like chemotaxis protein